MATDELQTQFALIAACLLGGVASCSFFLSYCFGKCKRPSAAFLSTIVALSCVWYLSSMSIVLMNRLVFAYLGQKFSYPVTITSAHMAMKGILALTFTFFSNVYVTPELRLLSLGERTRHRFLRLLEAQQLTWSSFAMFVVPIACATALDVWMSNLALRYVDVSVYTTTKSTAIIWNLVLCVCMRLVRPSPPLMVAVLAIGSGVIMASLKDAGVNPIGITCAMIAALSSASRWVVTERFFSRPGMQPNVVVLIALLGPITVLSLLPPMAFEVADMIKNAPIQTTEDVQILAATMVGGGVLAFSLVMTELQLVAMTSALTLSVIGHAKDAIVIFLSFMVFHDELSALNWSGVALTVAATTAYSIIKAREKSAAAEQSDKGSKNSARSSRTPRDHSNSNAYRSNDHDGIDTTSMATRAHGAAGASMEMGKWRPGGYRPAGNHIVQLNLDSDSDDDLEIGHSGLDSELEEESLLSPAASSARDGRGTAARMVAAADNNRKAHAVRRAGPAGTGVLSSNRVLTQSNSDGSMPRMRRMDARSPTALDDEDASANEEDDDAMLDAELHAAAGLDSIVAAVRSGHEAAAEAKRIGLVNFGPSATAGVDDFNFEGSSGDADIGRGMGNQHIDLSTSGMYPPSAAAVSRRSNATAINNTALTPAASGSGARAMPLPRPSPSAAGGGQLQHSRDFTGDRLDGGPPSSSPVATTSGQVRPQATKKGRVR